MPTVLEDVAFGPLNLGLKPEDAVERATHFLGLVGMAAALEKAPYHLSEGEKRRVAIAGVLAMEPEILVLDEPTTFLDPVGQRDLLELLRGLPQSKIIVTHNTFFAEALAQRAVFFEKGKIAGEGETADVLRRFSWSPLLPSRLEFQAPAALVCFCLSGLFLPIFRPAPFLRHRDSLPRLRAKHTLASRLAG